MDLLLLRERFPFPDLLTFEEEHGLARVRVHTPQTTATIYLQGAHLTAWQPAGSQPVIFVSRMSEYAPGKAIRGGIPVVFPWFATDTKADRVDGHPGPSHGFARIQEWTLSSVREGSAGLQLTFLLAPTAMSRSMGFDHFQLTLEFTLGRTLALRLTVANVGDKPLSFEDAFHAYYAVRDVHEVTVLGLEQTSYIDKTDAFRVRPASGRPVTFSQATDRIYNGTAAACDIHDPAGHRKTTVRKAYSSTTVVWNPWENKLPDLGPWEWHEFVAVETANVGVDAITLAPGGSHTLQLEVTTDMM